MSQSILTQITANFQAQLQTIAVAESVTGGLLQFTLAAAENASSFFQGGLTAYNAQQKYRHLLIDPAIAFSCNCVSGDIAATMALNVAKSFMSDWGIGITGYASPLPNHHLDPLFAYYSICFRGEILCTEKILSTYKEPIEVQTGYVYAILSKLLALQQSNISN